MSMPRFHLAFPVRDLREARHFYTDVLGCGVGRESDGWVDFDFRGHQITAHLVADQPDRALHNPVDGQQVPARHFGLVLDWDDWQALADRLREAGVRFLIEPCIRFEGEPGEQATLFITDPSGNALEFKSFRDPERIFAR
jgi:extradiol dioxygenase family protein